MNKGRIHIDIGDTQVKPGVDIKHLTWIGRYIVDQFYGQDVAIVHNGDHWDMESLSSYDRGKMAMEGRRYKQDVKAGNKGFARLNDPIVKANRERKKGWWPERYFLRGNHEDRITRAIQEDAKLDGTIGLEDLDTQGWTVVPFLEILELDGIAYSHYFYNPNTGRPYAGENLYTRLKTIGRSFTMGHQQGLKHAVRAVGKTMQHGLVLGSTYLHEEKYLGPQGEAYWRGIVVCHQVEKGSYDPMFVSLEFLCRKYEGMTLSEYMKKGKRDIA